MYEAKNRLRTTHGIYGDVTRPRLVEMKATKEKPIRDQVRKKNSCRLSIAFLVGRIVFEHFMIKSWCWTYIQLTFLSDYFKTISRLFSSINTRPLDFVSYWALTKILNIEMMLRNSLWLWMKVLFNPRKTPLMPINIKLLSKDEIVISCKAHPSSTQQNKLHSTLFFRTIRLRNVNSIFIIGRS